MMRSAFACCEWWRPHAWWTVYEDPMWIAEQCARCGKRRFSFPRRTLSGTTFEQDEAWLDHRSPSPKGARRGNVTHY